MADAKLAARTADRIIGDIAELGWPEGRVIGSEAELLRRYAVSRAVLRAAITLIERHGVARMRLGVVVAGLDVRTVADAVSEYLVFVGVGVGSVPEVQATIERAAAALAADRIDGSTLVALRVRSASGGPDVPLSVVADSGNPALEFFLDLLYRGIVEAMPAGDHQLARRPMQRHPEALVEWAG